VSLLSKPQREALRRILDSGPNAWNVGPRTGGAVARMFQRMVTEGLCTGPPYEITDKGRSALIKGAE